MPRNFPLSPIRMPFVDNVLAIEPTPGQISPFVMPYDAEMSAHDIFRYF